MLQKTIPAAVDFVKQSWKKEDNWFGPRSPCHRRMWALARQCDVYIGASLSINGAHVICVQMLIYHGIMYAWFCSNSLHVELQAQPKPRNAFHYRATVSSLPPCIPVKTSSKSWIQLLQLCLMVATDQSDCGFVHAHTSLVGIKRFTNVHA